MPSEIATPVKPQVRNQRQTKTSSPKSQEPSDNMQEAPASSPTPNKQKRRNRNNRSQSKPKELPLTNNNHPVSPLTPPRATNQLDMLPLDGNVSPIVPVQKSVRAKKRSNKSNLHNMSAPTEADASKSISTILGGNITPVKSAPQMYAGPTFHASPAPSSLPIPKFFSRSAPPTDTESSSKVTLNEHSSEDSSSAGDESPTLRNSVRAEERKIVDPSPLDILFNADREEKARRNLVSPVSLDHARAHSASPMSPSHRTHSNNHIGQAAQPTELEGSPYMVSEGPRIESSPSILLSKEASSAQAKTAALKNLLSLPSPSPQRPQSAIWSTASTRGSSPASTPGPFTGSRKSVSGSSTPLYTPNSSFASPPYNSTDFLSSPSINSKRSSQSRPMSSQLRQDVTNNLLADLNELPSSPSPSRYKLYKNPVDAHSGNIFSFPKPTSLKFQPEDALRATAIGLGNSSNSELNERRQESQGRNYAELEANLRQILKVPL